MSLFQQLNQNNNINPILQMAMGNPQAFANKIMSNPKFQQWKAQNYGKTPQQICQENGIDYNSIKPYLTLQG